MPIIQGDEINDLVDLLNSRRVRFYHACHLKDFKSYIQLGGVPSRSLLEESGLPFTAFDTDDVDKENDVWEKVFGNLQDFGSAFAQGTWSQNTAPTPNPYGPIQLVFNPEVFLEATDVAICLRSAGGNNFDRAIESLGIGSVNRIFQYEDIGQAPTELSRAYIARNTLLRQRFNNPDAMSPEVSCTVPDQKFTFNHIYGVIVDEYTIANLNLRHRVRELKNAADIGGWINTRFYSDGRSAVKQEFGGLLIPGVLTPQEIVAHETTSEGLKSWAGRIIQGDRTFFFNRFANYLRNGTILELQNDSQELQNNLLDNLLN